MATLKNKKETNLFCQSWRAAKEALEKNKTYENAVELQRSARILKDSVKASLKVLKDS